MKKRRPYTLISERLSHDTIDAAQRLLDDAKRGNVIGLAYCVMYRAREYAVEAAGEAYENPTFALGMAQVLARVLTDRAMGEWER